MAEITPERRRLLNLAKLLMEETDAEHGIGMAQIISRLAQLGIPAERKSIYRDIAALREVGLDIQTYRRAPVEYGLATRPFSLEEISLMVDCVQSSRFLTNRRSRQLVDKIKGLASPAQREELERSVHVEGRVSTQQESALPQVGLVQRAIHLRRQIAFSYCDYGCDLRRHPRQDEAGATKAYRESPLRVVYSEGNYYMLAYNQRHDGIVTYRIDRMARIRILDEAAVSNELTRNFDGAGWASRSFSMYSGKTVAATFLVDASVMNAFVDRFGSEMIVVPAEDDNADMARITAHVMDAPTLYGWLAQFGTKVRIESPAELARGFREHLERTLSAYEDE